MPDELDYYETLQVSPRAERGIIDVAYRKLAQKYHPDVNADPIAHQRMRELNQALDVLSDPGKRADYDRKRQGVLAQRALAAKPTTLIFPALADGVGLRDRLRRRPVTWVAVAGGAGIALATSAMIAVGLATGGGGESSDGLRSFTDFERPGDSSRREAVLPAAPPTERPAEPPPATPTPTESPEATASLAPRALSVVRDDSRPRPTPAAPAAAPVAVPTPAPAPDPVLAPTPPPATPAPQPPQPTASPPQCSVNGGPQLSESGNLVSFTYGEVVSFQSGAPDVLVVDIAGTTLVLVINGTTDVRGELDTATVVNGEGRRARDSSITAQLVEVVCPD